MTTTAFQIGAFQFTGFQEARTIGSGGMRWLLDQSARERKRKRKELEERKRIEEEREEAMAAIPVPIVMPKYVRLEDAPVERTIPSMMLRARMPRAEAPLSIDRDVELADFRELMACIAELDEVA